jgi:hypothetical protein
MTAASGAMFGDYIVYVDESGDHDLDAMDRSYPMFVLAFCSFEKRVPVDIVMADKKSISTGLQLADLVARPIGLQVLRPGQPNRAFEVLAPKIRRRPSGKVDGWGSKVFPPPDRTVAEGPRSSPRPNADRDFPIHRSPEDCDQLAPTATAGQSYRPLGDAGLNLQR